jgi:hypothetical protein
MVKEERDTRGGDEWERVSGDLLYYLIMFGIAPLGSCCRVFANLFSSEDKSSHLMHT